MLISLDKNICVLAMTKTGSTAVEATLAPHCDVVFQRNPKLKHMQLRKYLKFVGPLLKAGGHDLPQTTCLFREPIDWLGSWYRYRSRKTLIGHKNSTAQVTFDQFAECYMHDEQPDFARVGRPSRFVTTRDGAVGVDRMFRYDRFNEFVGFLEDQFETRLDMPKLNASPTMELELSPDIQSRLQVHFQPEYEIYDSI